MLKALTASSGETSTPICEICPDDPDDFVLNSTKSIVDWTGKNGKLWEDFADGFSKAHVMLADFAAWPMEYVAGLREPLEPGCGRFLIAPLSVKGLDWAKATTKTPKGEYASGWRRTDKGVLYSGRVPEGCKATLRNPKLWWPRNKGPQQLYGLKVRFRDSKTGSVSDEKRIRFGVREFASDQSGKDGGRHLHGRRG